METDQLEAKQSKRPGLGTEGYRRRENYIARGNLGPPSVDSAGKRGKLNVSR